MKYMERGGFQSQPLMRLTLGLTLAFLAGLWVTNLAMFGSKLGWTPSSVAAHYLGSEADFRPARTLGSMLETTHAHLPVMAIVVLLVTHLLIFAPWSERVRRGLIWGTFASALLNEASGWLVLYASPSFAWLKLAAFAAFQALFGFGLAGLARLLASGSPKGRRGSLEPRRTTSPSESRTI